MTDLRTTLTSFADKVLGCLKNFLSDAAMNFSQWLNYLKANGMPKTLESLPCNGELSNILLNYDRLGCLQNREYPMSIYLDAPSMWKPGDILRHVRNPDGSLRFEFVRTVAGFYQIQQPPSVSGVYQSYSKTSVYNLAGELFTR